MWLFPLQSFTALVDEGTNEVTASQNFLNDWRRMRKVVSAAKHVGLKKKIMQPTGVVLSLMDTSSKRPPVSTEAPSISCSFCRYVMGMVERDIGYPGQDDTPTENLLEEVRVVICTCGSQFTPFCLICFVLIARRPTLLLISHS